MARDRTALVVVDMQNLFVDAVGPHGPRVVTEVNALVGAVADAGGTVLYTRDVDPVPGTAGTPRAELHADLRVRGPVVAKGPGARGGFSGFGLAPPGAPPGGGGLGALAGHLRAAAAEHVVVVGIAADVCVSATAMDARRLGYPVTMPLRATAFVGAHPGGDEAALQELRAAGVAIDATPASH